MSTPLFRNPPSVDAMKPHLREWGARLPAWANAQDRRLPSLEARRVPGDGRTPTVVLDRGPVSEHTLISYAATPHPAHVLRRATPPSPPAMTLPTRATPGLNKGTENQHTPAGTLSRPPGVVIPNGHPTGRRPCGTRGPHVSPKSQRRHPVLFSISPKIIRWRLKVSRPSSLRSSPQNKKNRPLFAYATLSFPFYFAPSLDTRPQRIGGRGEKTTKTG